MKLHSLHLHGFKSFADRTTIEFRDGVTAIVGSNGCGKSNIADAVRWVLGEQRASAMRSAKMEDVIFQGTARRRPLNFAEVSLLFTNEQGRVPIPQTEIEVSRKTFREGGSDYALNRSSCRLRDIHHLLRDTGLGANAYSIIEGSMIETLLSDRAEERRLLFEEAAGIGKYKDSRKAAARRLEAAETDLARLDDLVAEVDSKVRSLGRQRRKAERHRELRSRRLDLEVAIAHAELDALSSALTGSERRLAELGSEQAAARKERGEAETRLEERRRALSEMGRERMAVAVRLDAVRTRLDEREREILVADERRSHAEMRVSQLARERQEIEARILTLDAELERLAEAREAAAREVEALSDRRESHLTGNEELRTALIAQREAAEALASRSRSLAHDIAAAEGERTAAERRRHDAEERLRGLEAREGRLAQELGLLTEQTELWSSRTEELEERLGDSHRALDESRERVDCMRADEAAARDALNAAEDALTQVTSRLNARETLERTYEGFSPAVAAVLEARERFPGVLGPLADFIAADGNAATEAVEVHLGALLQALVVEDLATARWVRDWFRSEWTGGGSLLLLPRDAPVLTARSPDAAPGRGVGDGAAWVETLLSDLIDVGDADPLDGYSPDRARVGRGGDVVDGRGLVRLIEHGSGEGILARREQLARLRAERETAERERDTRLAERKRLALALAEAEEEARQAEERRRAAQAELRSLEEEAAAQGHQRARLQRDQEELSGTIDRLRAGVAEAAAAIEALEARLAEMSQTVDGVNAEADGARIQLTELEMRWEAARDEEAELRVGATRAEAELRDVEQRHAAALRSRDASHARLAEIERDGAELRASLDGLSGVRERAAGEVETLFRSREQETAGLAAIDARIAEVEAEIAALEERVRAAMRREGELSEERHRLDLRIAESRSRMERARERLEAEWGKPWDELVESAAAPEEGGPEEWGEEARRIAAQLESLGPVNMLAMDEYEEEERRLGFLREQRADLVKARDDLVTAIRQINRKAREVFTETFDTIRQNFARTFSSLFQGGECDIWLADPDDPLDSPIEIQASPRGKRTQRIHLLSGGERTLTALALLFALYLVKPSPFCVLDEVDAPLDDSNVGRFIQLLQDFKAETQFIVITHNPRTMEAADWIYGVTMEEPGISTIVGVELEGAWGREDRVA